MGGGKGIENTDKTAIIAHIMLKAIWKFIYVEKVIDFFFSEISV